MRDCACDHTVQQQPVQTGEILTDPTSSGRERPWRKKRLAAEAVAEAYRDLGRSGKARRCSECGTSLLFAECPNRHHKRLQKANFCYGRLCPMCSWRRSLRLTAEVSSVLHAAASTHPEWGWVMLTLTVRNVGSKELRDGISHILRGWGRLSRRRELGQVAGWLRVLEVTRHEGLEGLDEWFGTWHPHVHALLAVTPSYWGRGYISQARWRELWAEACGLDYLPVVEVHRVRQRHRADSMGHVAAEVGKYSVKDSDLVGSNHQDTVERVRVLDEALRGRKLIAWGGQLRLLSRQVLRPEAEAAAEDLVHVTGENHDPTCPVCGSGLIDHVYRWIAGMRQYVG